MLRTIRNNIQNIFSKFDTLLALLAIFLWVSDYSWRATNLDGFLGFWERLFAWNWDKWKPIVHGWWLMTTFSIVYWIGIILIVIVFIRLVWKLFTKKEDDSNTEILKAIAKKMGIDENEYSTDKKKRKNKIDRPPGSDHFDSVL